MYFDGIGTPFNSLDGVKWLTAAAEQDHHDAQFTLGMLFSNGRYLQKNEGQAFRWSLRAAENGNLMAHFTVGTFYMQGTGTEVNPALGIEWHKKAATLGLAESQYMLSVIYDTGIGGDKNMAESLIWLKQAAKNNHPEAARIINDLGLSVNLDPNIPSNLVVERAELALYQEDYEAALAEFLQAASMDNPFAQYQLGSFYLNGRGVSQSYVEARKWYLLAAENGDALAQYNLGVINMRGYGIDVDFVKAAMWFIIARVTNPVLKREVLAELATRMTPEQFAEAENAAKEWYSNYNPG